MSITKIYVCNQCGDILIGDEELKRIGFDDCDEGYTPVELPTAIVRRIMAKAVTNFQRDSVLSFSSETVNAVGLDRVSDIIDEFDRCAERYSDALLKGQV